MTITIEELRRLEADATPAPWRVVVDDDGNPLSGRPSIAASEELDCGVVHWDGFVQEYWRSARGDKEMQANAALIVAMRNALPELLKALEALKRLSTYEAFTNEGWGYSHPEITARVECARAALPPHGGVDVG